MKKSNVKALFMLISSMFLYGTIGIFRRYIPLSSGILAFARGLIGVGFLLILMRIRGQKIQFISEKNKILPLAISGGLMGFNWILLFEAYNYTTVATATLCYYMEPVIVVLVAPIFFKEKLSFRKRICVIAALLGMVFVSGVIEGGIPQISELSGILCGLAAAVLYSAVVILNKKITGVGVYEKTIIQLGSASIFMLPYLLITEDITSLSMDVVSIVMLLVVGIVHTGIAYTLYFGSMGGLKAQTIALFSYIDPVVAIILSALILKETMSIFGILGAVLILGSTIINELS